MSDEQNTNIITRVMNAVGRTDEPKPTGGDAFDAEKHTLLGKLPLSLHHLHNLLDAVDNEQRAALVEYQSAPVGSDEERSAKTALLVAKRNAGAVFKLFSAAVQEEFPSAMHDDSCTGLEILGDGSVAGMLEGDSEKRSSLGDVIEQLLERGAVSGAIAIEVGPHGVRAHGIELNEEDDKDVEESVYSH